LQLAQALSDQTAQAKILWNQLLLYRNINRASEAIACGERALDLARQLNLQEQMAFILNDLGYCFAFMADFKRAGAAFHEVSGLWRALNNVPMLADSLTGICLVNVFTGKYEAAINFFEQALQLSQTMDSIWGLAGCRHNIGYVYRERGQLGQAIFEMTESIRLSDIVGFISPLIIVRADLAILYGALGAFERGLEIARLAVNVAETKMPVFRVYALSVLAQLHLWQNNLSEVEALIGEMKNDPHRTGWGIYPPLMLQAEAELALKQGKGEPARALVEEALTATRQLGARAFLPYLLYLQGQIWLALGNPEVAQQALTQARAEAEALRARRTWWKILALLAEIEAQRGNEAEATQLRQEAGAILDYIIAHIPEDNLRNSFRTLPEVRALLEPKSAPRGLTNPRIGRA
jgi:tetratricopeptide (TPR) repeat protein